MRLKGLLGSHVGPGPGRGDGSGDGSGDDRMEEDLGVKHACGQCGHVIKVQEVACERIVDDDGSYEEDP